MAILVWTLWALFVCDCGLSFTVMNLLKKHIDTQRATTPKKSPRPYARCCGTNGFSAVCSMPTPIGRPVLMLLTLRLKKARQEYKRTLSLLRKAQKQALHATREELEKAMEQVHKARAEKREALRRLRLVQRLFLRWDEEEEDETGKPLTFPSFLLY